MTDAVDVFISGGGIAGLTAAAAFASAGFSAVVVDPAPPVTEATAEGADLRTTAILQPGREVLEAAGLWPRLAPHAAPLRVMRLADLGAAGARPRVLRDFVSDEISGAPFGWNLPNWLLRREMVARLDDLPGAGFRPGIATRDVLSRRNEAIVTLSDGTRLSARMVIAADGRDSPLRRSLGIGARRLRYGQRALVFSVSHPHPHEGISTEIHRTGGPFTLVPLPDHQGRPASAVVWMERAREAARLARLPVADFEAAATARSAAMLGPLALISARRDWPIISQIADRFAEGRVALLAEAAHVVPPIGAQGLNMSLADIADLLARAGAAPDRLGAPDVLAAHARRRRPEALARLAGIDALNRASIAGLPLLPDLRAMGLAALHAAGPVRRGLMRAGLGAGRATPPPAG